MRQEPESLSSFTDATTRELEAYYDDWSEGYDADLDAWGYRHKPGSLESKSVFFLLPP